MMMVDGFTIITDLGGVLVDVDKTPMAAALAKYSPFSKREIAQHFSHTRLTADDLDFGKGLITPMQFYESMCRKLHLSHLSFGEFSAFYCNVFARKESVIRLLRQLGKEHTIALLSNTDALHYENWSLLLGEDMKLFKEAVLSFQVHAAKPGTKIFFVAAERLGLKPEQCIYIDDVEEYVVAAEKIGMQGIHFVSLKKLKEELAKLGVTV